MAYDNMHRDYCYEKTHSCYIPIKKIKFESYLLFYKLIIYSFTKISEITIRKLNINYSYEFRKMNGWKGIPREGQMDGQNGGWPTDRYCVYKCLETYFQVKLKKKLSFLL